MPPDQARRGTSAEKLAWPSDDWTGLVTSAEGCNHGGGWMGTLAHPGEGGTEEPAPWYDTVCAGHGPGEPPVEVLADVLFKADFDGE